MKKQLLVVDDEPLILELIEDSLRQAGYEVRCASGGQEALSAFERQAFDLAILDYSLPDLCGADLFRQLRAGNPELPVIFLTGHPNLSTAVDLMKQGVRDYLTKPFNQAELIAQVHAIFQSRGTEARPAVPSAGGRAPGGYIFGSSAAIRRVEEQIRNLPRYPDATVLITGATGTGKSAAARRIHELTWGDSAPFVEIDCSTIPRELCESELFGHEKGSFTGAHRTKPGLFEAAGRGTAFLDEIGELDLPLQAKFLRVLEARQFKRVGGQATLPMAARVVAATNRCLPELVREGKFREDLYFRLNMFELWMPALKERPEDILMLATHFLKRLSAHYRKPITGFSPEAVDFLRQCEFPGNVRELRNMVERAVINCDSALLQFSQLVSLSRGMGATARACPLPEPFGFGELLREPEAGEPSMLNLASIERQKLHEALAAAGGNKSEAAKLVGLSRTAFYRRLQKHQMAA
jgi:DNA-binding NtrC family response regulator